MDSSDFYIIVAVIGLGAVLYFGSTITSSGGVDATIEVYTQESSGNIQDVTNIRSAYLVDTTESGFLSLPPMPLTDHDVEAWAVCEGHNKKYLAGGNVEEELDDGTEKTYLTFNDLPENSECSAVIYTGWDSLELDFQT